jgi:hypothetical protein
MSGAGLATADWADIGHWLPWWVAAPVGAGLVSAPFYGVGIFAPQLDFGVVVAVITLGVLAAFGDRSGRRKKEQKRFRGWPFRLAAAVSIGMVATSIFEASLNFATFLLLVFFFLLIWGVGAIIRWVAPIAATPPRWAIDAGLRASSRTPRRVGITFNKYRIIAAAVGGAAASFVFATNSQSLSQSLSSADPLALLRLFTPSSLLVFVVMFLLFILTLSFGAASLKRDSWSRSVRRNLLFGLVRGILVGLTFYGFLILIAIAHSPTQTFVDELLAQGPLMVTATLLLLALFLFAPPAAIGIALTSGGRFLLATVAFAVAGRLPWRVEKFLLRLANQGLLRRSGQAYAFRHDRLRHLVSTDSSLQ